MIRLVLFAIIVITLVVLFVYWLWRIIRVPFISISPSLGKSLSDNAKEFDEEIGAKYGFMSKREYIRGRKKYKKLCATCESLSKRGIRSYKVSCTKYSDAEMEFIRHASIADGIQLEEHGKSTDMILRW